MLSSSSSAGKAGAGGVGGRADAPADRLLWPFDFRGRIEPVHPFDFFFFLSFLLLFFVLVDTSSDTSPAESEPCSDAEPTETALGVELDELELEGRDLTGEPDAVKDSRPKNDQRLKVLDGLGVVGVTAAASATSKSAGIEFRRFGDVLVEFRPTGS